MADLNEIRDRSRRGTTPRAQDVNDLLVLLDIERKIRQRYYDALKQIMAHEDAKEEYGVVHEVTFRALYGR